MAQVIVAVQMVLEEKFVYQHDVHPLRAVGTEGTVNCVTGIWFTLLQELQKEDFDLKFYWCWRSQ